MNSVVAGNLLTLSPWVALYNRSIAALAARMIGLSKNETSTEHVVRRLLTAVKYWHIRWPFCCSLATKYSTKDVMMETAYGMPTFSNSAFH
jgi:hypothetical protein